MSDNVRGFDSVEEMVAWLREQEKIANANVTPDQAEIGYGAYWVRVDEPVLIFGYVPTQAEVEASESGEGAEPEELKYTMDMLADAHRRGYRYGRAYSVLEPAGEWGSTHISSMIKIEEWQFKRAQALNWDRDQILDSEQKDGFWLIGHMLRAGWVTPEQIGLDANWLNN